MWQQEWEALEERLNNPEGELDMPIDTVPMVFPTLEYKGHYRIYTPTPIFLCFIIKVFSEITTFSLTAQENGRKCNRNEIWLCLSDTINKHLLFVNPDTGSDM